MVLAGFQSFFPVSARLTTATSGIAWLLIAIAVSSCQSLVPTTPPPTSGAVSPPPLPASTATASPKSSSPKPSKVSPSLLAEVTSTNAQSDNLFQGGVAQSLSVSSAQNQILPKVNPLKLRGRIAIAGSHSLTPLARVLADRFIEEGFSGQLQIDPVGSGVGFQLFCEAGRSDIAIASRAITPEETQTCLQNGRQPVAFEVGQDAVVVVIDSRNTFLLDITTDELAKVLTVNNWSDVRSDWPTKPIRRVIPNIGSGATALVTQTLFEGNTNALLKAPNTEFFSESDDTLIQNLALDSLAIGFFSYSYYQNNYNPLRIISINQQDPIDSDNYVLMRPLLLYSDANVIRENAETAAFLNFFLTHTTTESARLNYFAPSDSVLMQSKQTLYNIISDIDN